MRHCIVRSRGLIMKNKILCFICLVFLPLWSSCEDASESPKRVSISAVSEELADEVIIKTESKRVLRNAPQYLAIVSKMLGLNPSDLSKASEFETLKEKLPNNTFVTLTNPSDAVFIAASKVATAGCGFYIKEDASEDIHKFVTTLAGRASFDETVQRTLSNNALQLLVGTELETQENATKLKQSKIITCSYIVVTKILF